MLRRVGILVALLVACGYSPSSATGTDGIDVGGVASTSAAANTDSTLDGGSADDSTSPPTTRSSETGVEPKMGVDRLDLLIVVENTPGMAVAQSRFAEAAVGIVRTLETAENSGGVALGLDVHMMLTTTDLGNPVCPVTTGYSPANGAPVTRGCNARLAEFPGETEVCTRVCPNDVAPNGNFIHFGPRNTPNLPDVGPMDVDGDGELDSSAAQAAACLAAVGLVGCPYASPLEAMQRALDQDAAWNTGPDRFLRPDAALGIIIVSDGLDCSLSDTSAMNNPDFMNTDPDSGEPAASPAICWNAGTSCEAAGFPGLYDSCVPAGEALHPVSEYSDFLVADVGLPGAKGIFMIVVTGVPPVTAHGEETPFFPTEGGLRGLVYRDVVDGPPPNGDVLPGDTDAGITAAHKQFQHGIGPACADSDRAGNASMQATPDPRTLELCRALDRGDEPGDMRCCVESICDMQYGGVLGCLGGVVMGDAPFLPPPW